MKRMIALTLTLCMLLSGCAGLPAPFAPDSPGVFSQLAELFGGSGLQPFSRLAYEAPDPAALRDVFGNARRLAETGGDADALMDALDLAFEAYDEFYTMDSIAMIRSDRDQTDEYYRDEYDRCERMGSQVEQWYEQMLRACAVSELRQAMEDCGYFMPGDLDYYEQDEIYDDALVALYQRESDLLAEYRALIADDVLEIDGEEMSLNEYLARESLSEEEHESAYLAWLEQVNGEISRIYAELIGVRLQIAAAFGYDSYEQFCYDGFGREYTPAEAKSLLEEIRRVLGPYREELTARGEYDRLNYPALSERALMDRLTGAMNALGEPAAEVFDFMKRYELYDVSADLRKSPVSYTAYLYSYEAPYLFVDAYGDVEDQLTVAHEFGHFLAARTQRTWNAPLDLDETWSQGMEYLTMEKLRGTVPEYDDLLRIKLLDAVDTYTLQAACSAFEAAAYALPESERTGERFNELCLECMREFGQIDGDERSAALWWTQVTHIFEYPFYVVSYCTSADTAMQIYQMALEDPDGAWEAYQILMERWDGTYTEALEAAGLESPMTPGRIESAKRTIEAQLPG